MGMDYNVFVNILALLAISVFLGWMIWCLWDAKRIGEKEAVDRRTWQYPYLPESIEGGHEVKLEVYNPPAIVTITSEDMFSQKRKIRTI